MWQKLNKFKIKNGRWLSYYDKVLDKIMGPENLKNGYLIHECVLWSKLYERWFLCPRKFSENPFDLEND